MPGLHPSHIIILIGGVIFLEKQGGLFRTLRGVATKLRWWVVAVLSGRCVGVDSGAPLIGHI